MQGRKGCVLVQVGRLNGGEGGKKFHYQPDPEELVDLKILPLVQEITKFVRKSLRPFNFEPLKANEVK